MEESVKYPKIRFSKVRDVKSPVRGHALDAGFDMFVPTDLRRGNFNFHDSFNVTFRSKICNIYESAEDEIVSSIVIGPLGRVKIPAGIHFDIPKGWALIACNKSGVSSKKGIVFMANLLDAGYQGEAHISIANLSDTSVSISAGEKIIQLVMIPINDEELVEIASVNELYSFTSTRGSDGFGSTGNGIT